jgi:hypothetical protein
MDEPLACLAQHIRDSDKFGRGEPFLYALSLRVGKFPDRSGKTAESFPSENPRRLQTYFQDAVQKTGLFTIASIDDGEHGGGDLPLTPGGSGHAPTDYRTALLLTGALDGDSDISSRSAEGSLNIGPLQLLFSGNDRVVGQRLYAELVANSDGTLLSREVNDPYAGVRRRMHMAVTTNLVLPEGGWQLGGGWFGASGDGGIGSVGANVKLARTKALTLATKAVWFELLRRMTDSYAASETCITPRARAAVSFPRKLDGVVMGPMRTASRAAAPRRAAPQPSAQPDPRDEPQLSMRPKPTAEPQPIVAQAPRTTAPQIVTAHFGGTMTPISLASVDPGRGDRAVFGTFERHLPPSLKNVFGAGSAVGLFNAAARVLESQHLDRRLRLEADGRWVDLVAGPPVRRPPEGPGPYCRVLSLAGSTGGTARLEACRDQVRAIWRFATNS